MQARPRLRRSASVPSHSTACKAAPQEVIHRRERIPAWTGGLFACTLGPRLRAEVLDAVLDSRSTPTSAGLTSPLVIVMLMNYKHSYKAMIRKSGLTHGWLAHALLTVTVVNACRRVRYIVNALQEQGLSAYSQDYTLKSDNVSGHSLETIVRIQQHAHIFDIVNSRLQCVC